MEDMSGDLREDRLSKKPSGTELPLYVLFLTLSSWILEEDTDFKPLIARKMGSGIEDVMLESLTSLAI